MSCDDTDFISLANPGVQSLVPYQPGKPVSELEREFGISGAVKLASNENPLGPGPRVLEAARQALNEMTRYPDGNAFELKQKLAEIHDVTPDWITIGNGSNDVLEFLARAYLRPGTNSVFARHSFAVYPLVTQAVGADANVAAANAPDHAQPYGHNLESLRQAIDDRTRLVFVANPNNPTGTWLEKDALEAFVASVPDDVIVVIDEAYIQYAQAGEHANTFPDASLWLKKYSNLVVTRTFSKVYGLASLRIGYALANPQITDILNRVRQPFNSNAVAQAAALAALQDEEYVKQSVEMNRRGMEQLDSGLRALDLEPLPSVGNFVCVRAGESGEAVFNKMLPLGVIVRPVDNYQLPGFIRVTIGTEAENRRFLEVLEKVL